MKPTTVRLEESTIQRLDGVAESLGRSRTWVIKDALDRYLKYEEWFIHEVEAGLEEARSGHLASSEEVRERFRRWGVDVDQG